MVRYARRCHNLAMANRQLQGWSADPFGVHEERYFSAGRATKLVRDGKVESYDDPPSAATTYYVPDGTAEAERFAPGPAPGPGLDPRMPRRSRAPLVLAALAIVAGTTAGLVVLVRHSPPATAPGQAPAASAAAFVIRSAGHTLAERTADVTVSGSVQAGGQNITINGTGQIDFITNDMALDMSIASSTVTLTEKAVLVNGNQYVALGMSGPLSQLFNGNEWFQMPASQSGSANLAGSDPRSSLAALEQSGNSVRTLGTETIDGVSCNGYLVTVNKQAEVDAIRAQSAKMDYSPAMTQQELTLAQDMSPPTITVWLDGQGLVRQMSVNLGVQAGGSSSSVAANLVMDYTNFGTPVDITAPPPVDIVSYQSFLQELGTKG
jgi:hypothetical protein